LALALTIINAAIWLPMSVADAKPIKPDCTLANDLAPAVDKLAANIYGIASYGKWAMVILAVVAIFVVFTKHLTRVVKGILIIFAIALLLTSIPAFWSFAGGPSC
jgi:hypothetical protein